MRFLRVTGLTLAAFVVYWFDALHLLPGRGTETHAAH